MPTVRCEVDHHYHGGDQMTSLVPSAPCQTGNSRFRQDVAEESIGRDPFCGAVLDAKEDVDRCIANARRDRSLRRGSRVVNP